MSQQRAWKVGVVEGQPLLAHALIGLLASSEAGAPAGVWSTYAAAVGDWATAPPDVAIVDPALVVPDPVRLLQENATGLDVPLLLFSRRHDIDYLHLLLASGAGGVLGTDAEGPAVLEALSTVASRGRYVPPEVRLLLSDRLLAGARPAYLELSAREREVLAAAVCGASAPQIADALFLGVATIKTHLRNAYAKLGVHDRASALRELIRIGVLSADGAEPPRPRSRGRIRGGRLLVPA